MVERFLAEILPGVSKGSDRYRAAAVLLVGPMFDNNIGRVAGVTRYPVRFVAQVARRLTDNGVWRGSDTVAAWWGDDDIESFHADVRVATGESYRRRTAGGGYEWAAVGAWWKQYDYASTGPRGEVAATYLEVPARLGDDGSGWDGGVEEGDRSAAAYAGYVGATAGSSEGAGVEGAVGGRGGRAELVHTAPAAGWLGAPELFPHAVWLR
jgi:hypothetical protein